METRDALRQTASVRSFSDEAVPDADVYAILDDARFAPSGGNRQPWKVAVVKDTALRRGLADAMKPVWNEYIALAQSGRTPFAVVNGPEPLTAPATDIPFPLLDAIEERSRRPCGRGRSFFDRNDGRRPCATDDLGRRFDLSVLLEHPPFRAGSGSWWRHDDLRDARRSHDRPAPRTALRPRARCDDFLGATRARDHQTPSQTGRRLRHHRPIRWTGAHEWNIRHSSG